MNFAATLCRRVSLGQLVTKAPAYSGLHGVEGLGLMIRRGAAGSTTNGQDLRPNFLGVNTDNAAPPETPFGRVAQEVFPGRGLRSMNLVQRILDEDKDEQLERKDKYIVHFLLIKNNTFVTMTDAKGNRKTGASSGCLEEFKGGARLSRYAAEATAEHVGRSARNLRMKSVVMKVKGFSYFKKKKAVILGWKDGYTFGESKQRSEGAGNASKIMYIRDVTQLPHNGCRLPKQRRV